MPANGVHSVVVRWAVRCAVLLTALCLNSTLQQLTLPATDCDVTIVSTVGGNKSGTFYSPNWPLDYANNIRCVYRFIGLANEKVRINFTHFEVKGVRQRCQDDYLDVYTQVPDPYTDLLDVALHGRYCGDHVEHLPHLFISMYHVAIMAFYTDHESTDRGFTGTYTFIDAAKYTIGTTAKPQVCGQTIHGHTLSYGTLLSPTYPGMYPDNVFCFYKLMGRPGQRIRFTFNDLDVYSGGEHCPYDYVKIYDGYTNSAPVIDTYCGKLQDLAGTYISPSVYSTQEALHIEFVTKSGRVEPTKQPYFTYGDLKKDPVKQSGFNASFDISDKFVKLADFIKESKFISHIRGTECDMRVTSDTESNGTITTPNYPDHYPPGLQCVFYIDGLFDKENLEKTRLTFETFDIPSSTTDCSDSYVRAYISGQDIRVEADKYDAVLCGNHVPEPLVSRDPRLLLVFHAGSLSGRGFKANYQFITDYAIEGTPSPDGAACHFYYYSTSAKSGTFKSPRNPSHYPPNTTCTYDFRAQRNEQVRITFENFELQKNDPNCSHDYVELYMMRPPASARRKGPDVPAVVGRYCQENVPGPMVTDPDVTKARVIFHSDMAFVRAGFRARYEFIRKKNFGDKCDEKFRDQPGGEITSLHYPLKYPKNETCTYDITTRHKNARILLHISNFGMEGNYNEETKDYKCANAVLKIFTKRSSQPTYEICSNKISHLPTIISQRNYLKIKFVTSTHATGGIGYKLSWTEILPMTGEQCGGFRCEKNGHCIAESLRCNQVPNCGAGDASDEPAECDSTYTHHGVLHIILGVVFSLIVLVCLVVCILHRRRKARKKKNKKEIEVRYVTRGGTPNRGGPATDKLLKERTEKVSIV